MCKEKITLAENRYELHICMIKYKFDFKGVSEDEIIDLKSKIGKHCTWTTRGSWGGVKTDYTIDTSKIEFIKYKKHMH